MRIFVTQEHIHVGEANNDEGCPLYLALCEALGPDAVTSVDGEGAWIGQKFIAFPTKVFAFILLFDSHASVSPFNFEFDYVPVRAA